MRIQTGLRLTAMMVIFFAGSGFAEQDDRVAILALMDQAFNAVSSGNPDDWRAIQLAEGTSLSFRPDPNGKSGELELRISTNEALLAGEADDDHKVVERWTGDPTVMIHGPIAVVWGKYDYWIDGAFSHCGIDSADLVMVDGDWKIANWMWTVEKDNCPTNPSAPKTQ